MTSQTEVQLIICAQCNTEKQMVLETTDGMRIGVGYDGFISMPSAGMSADDQLYFSLACHLVVSK